jgi:hypothetical protein
MAALYDATVRQKILQMTPNTRRTSEASEIAILRVTEYLEHDITISQQATRQHVVVCQHNHVKVDTTIQREHPVLVLTERMIHTKTAIQQMAARHSIRLVSCTNESLTTITDRHHHSEHTAR